MYRDPERKHLPDVRPSVTNKRGIAGMEMYVTVCFCDDGSAEAPQEDRCRPIEIFCTIAKQGSDLGGLASTIATLISSSLQHGVPWDVLRGKMRATRYGIGDELNSSLADCLAQAVDGCIECQRRLHE